MEADDRDLDIEPQSLTLYSVSTQGGTRWVKLKQINELRVKPDMERCSPPSFLALAPARACYHDIDWAHHISPDTFFCLWPFGMTEPVNLTAEELGLLTPSQLNPRPAP
jgi:hypothetical protein